MEGIVWMTWAGVLGIIGTLVWIRHSVWLGASVVIMAIVYVALILASSFFAKSTGVVQF